jgi:hypothetical protein
VTGQARETPRHAWRAFDYAVTFDRHGLRCAFDYQHGRYLPGDQIPTEIVKAAEAARSLS